MTPQQLIDKRIAEIAEQHNIDPQDAEEEFRVGEIKTNIAAHIPGIMSLNPSRLRLMDNGLVGLTITVAGNMEFHRK